MGRVTEFIMTDTDPYTKIPNALLDSMAELGNAELRVLLAIVRRTAGWQKECDVISLTQLEKATGIARKNVVTALTGLLERGLIAREPAKRNGFCYRLGTLSNQSPNVTSYLKLPELGTLSNQSSPQLVTLSNTQKKDSKERIKRERETRAPTQANIDSLHEGVAIYKELSGRKPAPAMVALIASTVTDATWFKTCVAAWVQAGFNPGNVKGMIDWYNDPRILEKRNAAHNNGRHAAAPSRSSGKRHERYDK